MGQQITHGETAWNFCAVAAKGSFKYGTVFSHKFHWLDSQYDWCTTAPRSKVFRMWTWSYLKGGRKSESATALTHWPACWGELARVRTSIMPLSLPSPRHLWGVSHKYSTVFTKQAARATSCVCVSQILLMSRLNQPGPHPPPTNLHPPPRRSIKDTHTHIPISAHLAFQLLPHFSSPLPQDFFPLFLSLSLSRAPLFFSPSSPLWRRGLCVSVC